MTHITVRAMTSASAAPGRKACKVVAWQEISSGDDDCACASRDSWLSWEVVDQSGIRAELSEEQDVGMFVRIAAVGVVAYSVWRPLLSLGRVVLVAPSGSSEIPAAVASACYLPVVLWLVRSAVRGHQTRTAVWVLMAMAAGFLATLPFVGGAWLGELEPLAGLALIVVPWPWSIPVFTAFAVAPTPLAFALGQPGLAALSTADTVITGTLIAVLVWLVGGVRHLRGVQLELAHLAVTSERLMIEDELRETLEGGLATITAAGDRARALAAVDPIAAEAELRTVAGSSRAALAESRQLVRQYRQVPLRTELDTAAMLLSATGIRTRVDLPSGVLPRVLSAPMRSHLRSELARLLHENPQHACVITLARDDGAFRLDVHPDAGPKPPTIAMFP
jgi:hypothetical protein